IYYITAAAFILVTVLMILFLFMYRHREGRRAVYTHGNTTLELVWTVIPALVFIGLGFASKAKWEAIKVHMPDTDTVIQVTAELCGFGHSGMKGWLYVDSPADYKKWYTEQWPQAATAQAPAAGAHS